MSSDSLFKVFFVIFLASTIPTQARALKIHYKVKGCPSRKGITEEETDFNGSFESAKRIFDKYKRLPIVNQPYKAHVIMTWKEKNNVYQPIATADDLHFYLKEYLKKPSQYGNKFYISYQEPVNTPSLRKSIVLRQARYAGRGEAPLYPKDGDYTLYTELGIGHVFNIPTETLSQRADWKDKIEYRSAGYRIQEIDPKEYKHELLEKVRNGWNGPTQFIRASDSTIVQKLKEGDGQQTLNVYTRLKYKYRGDISHISENDFNRAFEDERNRSFDGVFASGLYDLQIMNQLTLARGAQVTQQGTLGMQFSDYQTIVVVDKVTDDNELTIEVFAKQNSNSYFKVTMSPERANE